MFLNNKRNQPGGFEYEQRILELEAELQAAQKLIDDQQHVLKANLGAMVAHPPSESDEEAAVSIPARPFIAHASYAEQPPIKLPDLGAPAEEIANRVMRAAADRGIVGSAPQQKPLPVPDDAPSHHALPEPDFSGPPGSPPRQGIGFPLIVSSVLLLGGVLFAIAWSHLPAWPPPRNIAMTKAPGVLAARVAVSSALQPALPSSVLASASGGPVLEPVVASHASTPIHRNGRHPIQLARRLRSIAHAGPKVALISPKPLRSRAAAPLSFHRHARQHRYEDPAEPGGQDWFDREASRHPQPGWDENDDKWLDKF